VTNSGVQHNERVIVICNLPSQNITNYHYYIRIYYNYNFHYMYFAYADLTNKYDAGDLITLLRTKLKNHKQERKIFDIVTRNSNFVIWNSRLEGKKHSNKILQFHKPSHIHNLLNLKSIISTRSSVAISLTVSLCVQASGNYWQIIHS